MGMKFFRQEPAQQMAVGETYANSFGRKLSFRQRCLVLAAVLFCLGRLCLGDSLTGSYHGSLNPLFNGTQFPGINMIFLGDGTFSWTMHGEWRSFWGDWVSFPAISGNGTYNYDSTKNKISLNSFWFENVESTNYSGVYCKKFFFYNLNSLSISPDKRSFSGQINCAITYYFWGDTELDQVVSDCYMDKDEPPPTPINNAQCIANTIPAALGVSESVDASITIENTGETAWRADDDFALAVIGNVGGISVDQRAAIDEDVTVQPGEQYTFVIHLVAPATPALCELRLRMTQESVEFFGDTQTFSINVGNYTAVRDWLLYQ